MRWFSLRILFLFALLVPLSGMSQVTDRAEVSGERYGAVYEHSDEEYRPVHYTHQLLTSDEGREAVRLYRQLKEQGHIPGRVQLMQSEIGDREPFIVRNQEESTAQEPVFDEIMFELTRSDENVEIWVEVDELGEDRISSMILDTIMDGLIRETPPNSVNPDRGVVEIVKDLFGDIPNVDGTGTLKVLITNIQDGWDPEEQPTFTAGFYDPVNLLPADINENSNEADIIYINSMPGIYREEVGFISPLLNTMAHELQHLIHDGFGGHLSLFQNEGQSELAEILTGFNSRPMNFLNSRSETTGDVDSPDRWIYRFRSLEPDVVLYDYQRAQLLHSYLEERVGPGQAGSLTRVQGSNNDPLFNDEAYMEVLDIPLQEFFTDFYITAYANNRTGQEMFSFSRPQFSNVQVANPGEIYNKGRQPWISNHTDTLFYGGSLYTQWFGVEDLILTISSSDGISQNILYRRGGETDFQLVRDIGEGEIRLDEEGLYEEIVLVSTNVEPDEVSPDPGDQRTFTYSGEWTTTDLVTMPLVYHGEPSGFFPIPEDGSDAFAIMTRISPDFDSAVQTIRFNININQRESAVQGDGELALRLREASQQPDGQFIPGPVITSQPLAANDVSTGQNYIGVSTAEWGVQEGEEYFISIEVIEDFGGLYLEFLLDDGVANETDPDPDYNPPRTFVGFQENGELTGWGTFQFDVEEPDETTQTRYFSNVLMAVNLVGFRDIEEPAFPDPPISDAFELIHNFPNPFHGETTIGFNAPEPASIEITVHDVLGRKVSDLFNGDVLSGFHSFNFQARGLASGIYFYRMIAQSESGERFTGSRQMTLIRR